MDQIPKSGFYYPNRFALITLEALEEVMGKNGLNAILNMAHMPHLIDHYPPANLERSFDFSDYSMLNIALEEMYGPRGGRGLALRAGRATFADAPADSAPSSARRRRRRRSVSSRSIISAAPGPI